jgi:transposase
VKGLAPLACKTDRIDAWVLAELARRDLVPAIWLPDPRVRAERERARWRLHLVRHRSSLKQRVHAVLLTHGKPCPVTDLFGVRGRQLLARLELPEPWQGTIEASLRLIDELDREIGDCERELRRLGADHRYVPLLCTVPGISWVLAYTIAAELGDINRFPSPPKLAGYSGLCPRVYQSGERDLRGPLSKQGPRYLRWALVEAATHACTHHVYRDRYQQTKARIGKQRGAKVAHRPRPPTGRGDLAHAQPQRTLRSQRRHQPHGRLTALNELRHRSELQSALSSHEEAIER